LRLGSRNAQYRESNRSQPNQSAHVRFPLLRNFVGAHSSLPLEDVQEKASFLVYLSLCSHTAVSSSRRRGYDMAALPNCLLIVTAEVDPEVEAEWNRWYDEVHLPDALACPGVLTGRRYVSADVSESERGQGSRTGRKVYTTVYELESPGAVETSEFAAMRGWSKFAPHVRSQTRVGSALSR
jgi:hypothetical protein